MKRYLFLLLAFGTLCAQSDLSKTLEAHNSDISSLKSRLEKRYSEAENLLAGCADEGDYESLLLEINSLRKEIASLEMKWKNQCTEETKEDDIAFSFWDQEETTIGQLVVSYGSCEYLYIVPPEVGAMKINLHSSLPIPRESWSELLEIILAQNGVGVKTLNTYARALYIMKQDLSAAKSIITDEKSLAISLF